MKSNRSKKFKTVVFTLIASLMLVSAARPAQAYSWPDITAMIFKQIMEQIYQQIQAMIRQTLKQKAAEMLRDKIEGMLSGGGGGNGQGLIIENYEKFIYQSAQDIAMAETQSFLDSISGSVSGELQNITQFGQQAAMNEIFNTYSGFQSSLDEYVSGGIDNVFNQVQGGGYAAWDSAISDFGNSAAGHYYMGAEFGQSQLIKHMDLQRVQAIANRGFMSKMNSGTNIISTPGSLIADLTAKAEGLSMDMVANANSISEIISSLASQILTQTIQNGINKVSQPVDNKIQQINNKYSGGMSKIQGTMNQIQGGMNQVQGGMNMIQSGGVSSTIQNYGQSQAQKGMNQAQSYIYNNIKFSN